MKCQRQMRKVAHKYKYKHNKHTHPHTHAESRTTGEPGSAAGRLSKKPAGDVLEH